MIKNCQDRNPVIVIIIEMWQFREMSLRDYIGLRRRRRLRARDRRGEREVAMALSQDYVPAGSRII